MLDQINSLIAQRTNYGMRTEVAKKKGYRLGWSNGSKGWYIYGIPTEKGEVLQLDANIIFVEATRKSILEVIDNLDPLPLYRNSFEYLSKAQ